MQYSNNYNIETLSASRYIEWDQFVNNNPSGTIFHTSLWIKLLIEAYPNIKPLILIQTYNGQIVSGFVCSIRKHLCFKSATTPLLTPYGGFLLTSQSDHKQLFYYLNTFFTFIKVVSSPNTQKNNIKVNNYFEMEDRQTYYINLSRNNADIWKSFESNVRQNIRKAEKQSTYTINNDAAVKDVQKLLQFAINTDFHKCSKLSSLIVSSDLLRNNRKIYAAYDSENQLISVIVSLFDNKNIYYSLAATSPEHKNSGIHSLLIWNLLKESTNRFHYFDFVGANIPSIRKFKSRFSPTIVEYHIINKNRTSIMRIKKIISMFTKS